ncbi:MAG: hypothetical protein V1678_05270 [Candidatus Aenigmatarchaeota archaeon]
MALIETAAENLLNPLVNLWNSFVSIFPGLIAAIFILIIGYLLALIIGHVVKVVIQRAGIDKAILKFKLPPTIGKIKVSSVLGQITKWYIFIIFIQAAADTVNLGTLSVLLAQFALWLPQLIVAVLAVFLGLFLAHYLSNLIERESQMKGIKYISNLFKVMIMFIAVVIALEQIGVEVSILQNTFLVIIGSIGIGFALAIGLAFGLGLKDKAAGMYESIKKNF